MKKIAVLTDFSDAAAGAAQYGFKLAAALQADLILYNCFVVPSAEPAAAQIAWPLEEYDALRESSLKGLRKLSQDLHKLDSALSPMSRIPTIHCLSRDGGLSLNFADLNNDTEIGMIIAGTHHSGFSGIIMGNHVRELIDSLTIPLLVIPPSASFRQWKDVVWASELQIDDLVHLPLIADLFENFKTTLTVAHIQVKANQTALAAEPFVEAVRNRLSAVNVTYQSIYSPKLTLGLKEIYQRLPLDLLIMIHHSRGLLAQLFGQSQSQSVAKNLNHPLLIIPG